MFKFVISSIFIICLLHVHKANADVKLIANILTNFPHYFNDAINLLNNSTQFAENFRLRLCIRDLSDVLAALAARKMWAIKVFDSWGKLPSGLLSGNMFELGDFDQCLGIDESRIFVPQYCVARVSKTELDNVRVLTKAASAIANQPEPRIVPTGSNMLGLNFGICVPNTCSQLMMEKVLKLVEGLLKEKVILSIVPDTCQQIDDTRVYLSGGDIAVILFLILIVVAIFVSTIYDIKQTRKNKQKSELMIAFSFYTNGKKLFAYNRSKSPDVMDCLNGIRVFSALWVIYAHAHVMVVLLPVFNFIYVPEWASEYTTIVLLLAPFSVDSFLFLSGLLVTWSILKHLTKKNGKINILFFALVAYIHRYLRLTPILAVVIVISLTLYKQLGSGPLYQTYIQNAINCDKYWWSALLYIQNYYNPEHICLNHTWYLSVDFQLFLVSPFLAYFVYRWPIVFVPVLARLVLVCMGWTFYLFYYYDLLNQFLNIQNDILDTFKLTYFPTHTRMGPWFVGMIFAYIVFQQRNKRVTWSKIVATLYWAITFVLFLILAYYSYELQQMARKATPLESAIYTPISRVLWSIILSLVIYGCIKGYGGPVNSFLSLPHWQPLARLTYSVYLIHMPIMLMTLACTRRPLYFSERNIILKFFGDFTVALILSVFASLAFESPIVVFEKILFGSRRKQRGGVESGGEAKQPNTN